MALPWTDDFEGQAADPGAPVGWTNVSDTNRFVALEVSDTTAASGSQSVLGDEAGAGEVEVRPPGQPYADATTAPVSVALYTTTQDEEAPGRHLRDGAQLELREGGTAVAHVGLSQAGLYYDRPGDVPTVLSSAVGAGEWVTVEVYDIDPATDTVSIRWSAPSASGTATGLALERDAAAGYTETAFVLDERSRFDDVRIGERPVDRFSFEDEPADDGVPADFEAVTDPRNLGQTRDGQEFVTTAVATRGTQSYGGIERKGSNALWSRPAPQPYAEPRTGNVSVSLRRPKTDREPGTGGATLTLWEGSPTRHVGVRAAGGSLEVFGDAGWTAVADVGYDTWVRATVYAVDPTDDTYSVAWETAVDSGTVTDVAMHGDMTAGYTMTTLSFDDEGYADDLVIENASAADGNLDGKANATWETDLEAVADATLAAEYSVTNRSGNATLELVATADAPTPTARMSATNDSENGTRDLATTSSGPAATSKRRTVALDSASGTVRLPLTSLSGRDARISIRAAGANVTIERAVITKDTDGDGLLDYHEEQTWLLGEGPIRDFSTDPTDVDTDDDGLTDSQEVTFERTMGGVGSFVPDPYSNPVRWDSDGDGLSDGTEHEGWTIKRAITPETAKAAIDARRQKGGSFGGHLDSTIVSSVPLRRDTDEDTLPDGREQALGTHPGNSDTDKDFSSDFEEIESQTYPTLHDFRPPRISGQVHAADGRQHYLVTLNAYDPAGLSSLALWKRNTRQWITFPDGKEETHTTATFSVDRGTVETIGKSILGLAESKAVTIVASDVHGQEYEGLLRGPNNFGKLAKAAEDLPPILDTIAVYHFAFYSGLGDGLNQIKNSLVAGVYTVGLPSKWGPAIARAYYGFKTLATSVVDSKQRSRVLGTLIRSYGERRQQLNPFDEGSKYHGIFASTFTVGSASSYLIPIAAQGKVAQLASKVPYLSVLVRAGSYVKGRALGALKGSAMWTGGKIAKAAKLDLGLAKRVRHVDPSTKALKITAEGGDALGETPVPTQVRVLNQFRDAQPELRKWLTENPARNRLARGLAYLQRTGDLDGERTLAGLSEDARVAMLRLDPTIQRAVVRADDLPEVDSATLGRAVKRLETMETLNRIEADEIVRFGGPQAVKATGEMPKSAIKALLEVDTSSERVGRALRRYSELAGPKKSQFEALLSDDALQTTWLVSVGSAEVSSQAVTQALASVERLRKNGYEIRDFEVGATLESGDRFYSEWYGPGYRSPVDENMIAIDARTTETDTWYRFTSGEDNIPGPFFVDKDQVDDLIESGEITTVEELQSKLAVPETKVGVVQFEVEPGTKVRVSEIGETFGGEGGLRQFEPRTDDMLKDADKLKKSDFPGSFGTNRPIKEVFDLES